LRQRTRFVAIVVRSDYRFLLDSGGGEDSLLVLRIELGRGLAADTRRCCGCGGGRRHEEKGGFARAFF
jgi:hypothetical protein